MATRLAGETELIQYDHDNLVLNNYSSSDKSKTQSEQNANKPFLSFIEHQPTVITSKTEFMVFGESESKEFNEQIILNSIPIDERTKVNLRLLKIAI